MPESGRLKAVGRSGRVAELNHAAGSGARGRRRHRPDCLLGDRGHDAKAIRQGLRGRHILPFLAKCTTERGSGQANGDG
jgi:hypothetical protein